MKPLSTNNACEKSFLSTCSSVMKESSVAKESPKKPIRLIHIANNKSNSFYIYKRAYN